MSDAVSALISSAIDVFFVKASAKHREVPWERSWVKLGLLAILALVVGGSLGLLLKSLV